MQATPRDSEPAHSLEQVLDDRERELVAHALEALAARPPPHAEQGRQDLLDGGQRLVALWEAIERFPRTQDSQTLGWRTRDLDSLLTRFASCQFYSLEAVLPTRAALARAFGMAKFNFARMLRYVLQDHLGDGFDGLMADADAVERSAVAAIIAEDVLRSIAADRELTSTLRRHAAGVLSALWDQRATRGLADFAPLLDRAWRAKASVRITYGTLQGVSELFQLVAHGCPEEFLGSFAEGDPTHEQYQALEEFVFNSTHEELSRMRAHQATHGGSALNHRQVAEIFGVSLEELHLTTTTPKDMFFTFRERESWARARRVGKRPGPKKTAEEYWMIHVLRRAEQRSTGEDH